MNDEQERSRILRKIRACFARADEARNESEAERAIALRQGNALMDKYGIEVLELGETDELGERGQDSVQTGRTIWKAQVVDAVGRLYGCKVYRSNDERGKRVTMIVGREHFRHVVADMAKYVTASIAREAAFQRASQSETQRFVNSFCAGAASAVHGQVREILAERQRGETAQVSDAKAMVLVDFYKNEIALNIDWLRLAGVHLKSRSGSSRTSDSRGYYAGKDYGKGIGLNDQLGRGGASASVKRLGNG